MRFLQTTIVHFCSFTFQLQSASPINPLVIEINDHLPYGQKYGDVYGPCFENSFFESLSLDMRVSIIEYLPTKSINSLMRTNQNNLYSCNQYIYRLLSHKFSYLLNVSNAINIKHLLSIPFVDSIKINVSRMPFYFGKSNGTSAKYIGLDTKTNNAFISFYLKKVYTEPFRRWKIISFVFNETSIESIYLSQGAFYHRWHIVIVIV